MYIHTLHMWHTAKLLTGSEYMEHILANQSSSIVMEYRILRSDMFCGSYRDFRSGKVNTNGH